MGLAALGVVGIAVAPSIIRQRQQWVYRQMTGDLYQKIRAAQG